MHMNATCRATTNAFAIAVWGLAGVMLQSCWLGNGNVSTVPTPYTAVDASQDSHVARCPPSAAIPSDWQTVVDETGTYELRIPRTFGSAPAGKYAFVHGGQVWQRGDATISLSFGHWAEYSFQDQAGQRCRVSVGDANVFVIVASSAIVAWYDRQSGAHDPGAHDPVVAVSSTNEAELKVLAPVTLSLKPRPKS